MANNGPKSLTSDDVNYLIYRYMQESGFHHAAFTFAHESQVHRTDIDPNRVAAGALVTLIQKGLQYLEVEANLDGDQVDDDFQLLDPHDLMTAEIDDLRQLVLEKRAEAEERAEAKAQRDAERGRKRERQEEARQQRQQQQQQAADDQPPPAGKGKAGNKQGSKAAAAEGGGARGKGGKAKGEQQGQAQQRQAAAAAAAAAGGVAPMDEDEPAVNGDGAEAEMGLDITDVTVLEGHQQEVFIATWSPNARLLATGSGDSTARLWDFGPNSGPGHSLAVLPHEPVHVDTKAELKDKEEGKDKESGRDITVLDWHPASTYLASGTFEGVVRIWDSAGKLQHTLRKHTGAILSGRWSKQGDMLLTGSVDNTAVVWDAQTGDIKQVFSFHTGACLDADWCDDTTFATCSSDQTVVVCRLGEDQPLHTFTGHTNEVNALRWDPSCKLLATCSDDTTAKVWSLSSSSDQPVHDFTGHSEPILTLRWSPTGPGTSNSHLPLLLATASMDATVKLWDVHAGRCYHTLEQHTKPIYSVSFSPDGRLMASGAADKRVLIWDVASGQLVKSHEGEAGIFEVSWSSNGDLIAVSFQDKSVHVLDVRTWQVRKD